MPLAAGALDRRITFQAETEVVDPQGSGEPVKTWADVVTVWANVQPLGGRELFASQQTAAKVDTRYRIRWRSGVTPEAMRILDENGRIFDIQAVQEIGRREGLEILATARGEVPA